MMTNLFSVFDPSSFLKTSLNWSNLMLWSLLIPCTLFVLPAKPVWTFNKLVKYLFSEISILLPQNTQHSMILFMSLFTVIMVSNSFGLLPYVFTSTSHMVITLSLALPIWASFYIFGWMNKPKLMFAHLVPLGTPPALTPFMVLIETLSSMIRPMTLAIRLAANMIAGHLLLSMLGSSVSLFSNMSIAAVVPSQTLLMILESAVAIIQAYVFTVLSVLYLSEI